MEPGPRRCRGERERKANKPERKVSDGVTAAVPLISAIKHQQSELRSNSWEQFRKIKPDLKVSDSFSIPSPTKKRKNKKFFELYARTMELFTEH